MTPLTIKPFVQKPVRAKRIDREGLEQAALITELRIRMIPATINALVQLRFAAASAASFGHACFHAGKMACSSLNRAFTTSTVPGGSVFGMVGSAGGW